jgi:hypothetical protein
MLSVGLVYSLGWKEKARITHESPPPVVYSVSFPGVLLAVCQSSFCGPDASAVGKERTLAAQKSKRRAGSAFSCQCTGECPVANQTRGRLLSPPQPSLPLPKASERKKRKTKGVEASLFKPHREAAKNNTP